MASHLPAVLHRKSSQSHPSGFHTKNALIIGIFAVLCALVSILFCTTLHNAERLYKRFFKNPYVRALAGGLIVIGLTMLVGNQTYNGTGMNIITGCMEGKTVFPLAFLLKMVFTAATLGAGYKGDESYQPFSSAPQFGTFLPPLSDVPSHCVLPSAWEPCSAESLTVRSPLS